MAPDARSFTTTSGSTDFGNSPAISGTYQGGGTEPRSAAASRRRGRSAQGARSGRWSAIGTNVFTIVQSGSTLTETTVTGETGQATITGNKATGTFTQPGDPGTGTFTGTMAPDGLTITFTRTTTRGAPGPPLTSTFIGCTSTARAAEPGDHDPRPADAHERPHHAGRPGHHLAAVAEALRVRAGQG